MKCWMSLACLLGVLASTVSVRGDDPYGDNPRLGGRAGRLNSRISRAPYEEVEVPDVLTLKGGVQREAYFLNIYGDRFVYFVKETERSWLREEVARSEVEAVDFHQYLPRDPVALRKIEPAKKQPALKDDVLSGVFRASQGRSITWTVSFQSELDKFLDWAEDATDYGTLELRSSFVQQVSEGLPPAVLPRGGTRGGTDSVVTWPQKDLTRSHEVRAQGKYYLYAPGSVNNDDWVLLLGGVIQTEIDHGRDTSLFTTGVPDETFILYFSPEKKSFHLAWSNVGSWTWSSLTGISFERLEEAAEPAELRTAPPRPAVPSTRSRAWGARQVLAEDDGELSAHVAADVDSWGARGKIDSMSGWRQGRSKLDGWKRPQYRLDAAR